MPLTGAEVAAHNNKDSCWVIVHGKAYDVTEFLPGTAQCPLPTLSLQGESLEAKLTSTQSTPEA